ncbi:MAG: hypothetical protein SWQ30_04760 [Thermodesulfobacteriota bacterium]|nr:hypothetical protein [Thermodesulfobacteriota bacterium]
MRTDCKDAFRQLDFVVQDARQEFPISEALVYEVIRQDGQHYLILQDGEPRETGLGLKSFAYRLQWHIHGHVFGVIGEYTRVHGGCAEHDGNRILVVGDSGVGKTTLMTRLLYEGFRVHCDELVMIRDGKAVPFPRRFHVKRDSLRLLPQIRPFIDDVPFVESTGGAKIFAFSPSQAGFDWVIEDREARLVFFLESNHGAETVVEECPKYLMVNKVMPLTFFSKARDHLKIGELCRVIDRAACFVLRMGNLDSAVMAIRNHMAAL